MTQQQYYHTGPVPPMGFTPVGPPHFHHPPMAARGSHYGPPHTMAQSSPPQSPSSAGYSRKDERTQNQYVKLKRKLVQKQIREGQPSEEVINGLTNNSSPVDDGPCHGSEEMAEEEETDSVEDMLSTIAAPNVSEVTARSALLVWSGPTTEPCDYPIIYDVLLGDPRYGKEGRFKSIYSGTAQSCRIQDLRPGQQYTVCLQARLDGHTGAPSEPAVFITLACEPDPPAAPKLISRTRTSLQLRWSTAVDNGSHILHYLLEYDEGNGGTNFVELTKSKGKQTTVTKLHPNKTYRFRLAAVNDCGRSNFSDAVAYRTAGFPPAQPAAPELHSASPSSLHIKWRRQAQDEDYTLQMEDPSTKHGFLAVYSGNATEIKKDGLRRNSEFRFRLQAQNDEGKSTWSETATFQTLPDRPCAPSKPFVKGKMHAHSFKAKWQPPADKGGSPVHKYNLELSSKQKDFVLIYSGSDTETVCDHLEPGTEYKLRVNCESSGGVSDFSDTATIITEAVCPGQCNSPVSSMRPEATMIGIRWEKPSYDGGAPVLEYDVELTTPENEKRVAYHGPDKECRISELQPGKMYAFSVRAINRVGAGLWSDSLFLSSGSAPPNTPSAPEVNVCSPTHLHIKWNEPLNNGSPITSYRLEISNTDDDSSYNLLYSGSNNFYDARNLMAFTSYFVRLAATNNAGTSSYSNSTATFTPASAPGSMCPPLCEATPNEISVSWKSPISNGSDIIQYNVEYGDQIIRTDGDTTTVVLDNLRPETQYRIRVQAVNNVGNGPFSSPIKICTLPLPPAPPALEVAGVGHNFLKLKWGDGRNLNFTQYYVEMFNQRAHEYQSIYQGMALTCKVNKLQEQTAYTFRICASNDEAGQGYFSEPVTFSTSIAPPSGLKAPKMVDVTLNTCSIDWVPCKSNVGNLVYSVQYSSMKDREFKQVNISTDFMRFYTYIVNKVFFCKSRLKKVVLK